MNGQLIMVGTHTSTQTQPDGSSWDCRFSDNVPLRICNLGFLAMPDVRYFILQIQEVRRGSPRFE